MSDTALAAAEKRIAELEQQLRRAKVEVRVRMHGPLVLQKDGCFMAGWQDCIHAEDCYGYQRGKAAVEAAIEKGMEGGNGTTRI